MATSTPFVCENCKHLEEKLKLAQEDVLSLKASLRALGGMEMHSADLQRSYDEEKMACGHPRVCEAIFGDTTAGCRVCQEIDSVIRKGAADLAAQLDAARREA